MPVGPEARTPEAFGPVPTVPTVTPGEVAPVEQPGIQHPVIADLSTRAGRTQGWVHQGNFEEGCVYCKLVNILRDTEHGGFPVVTPDNKFIGLITRFQLMTLLCKGFTNQALDTADIIDLKIDFSEFNRMRGHKLVDPKLTSELLNQSQLSSERSGSRINLGNYVNRSALALPRQFSLHRTYLIFRTLGLRHLTIVDGDNRVVGILTRKDLMGFSIDEKLSVFSPGRT